MKIIGSSTEAEAVLFSNGEVMHGNRASVIVFWR